MLTFAITTAPRLSLNAPARACIALCGLLVAFTLPLSAQQPDAASAQQAATPTAVTPPVPVAPPAAGAPPAAPAPPTASAVNEEELKQLLVGKPLYLRGFYLDDSLSFDEHGHLIGHSPQGSYTLSAVQIDRVRLTKHKVELEGARYGLHFLGQLAYEDASSALDRVRITPKKKIVKITIDRELVIVPKKKKVKAAKSKAGKSPTVAQPAPAVAKTDPAAPADPAEMSEADQLKAAIAAAPAAERPADPASVTTTISPAHAAKMLHDALDQIFASGIDDRLMAALPDFWRLYYQAAAAKSDYQPADPAVLLQSAVDHKAVLLSRFEPESNEYAQANGVAGMALYHTVVGADGKPGEIAVGRPIGFGLDENAVAAIRKASFQPATKNGKNVPVLLDLVVQFRIFSNRTAVTNKPDAPEKPAEPLLPGPYSVPHS